MPALPPLPPDRPAASPSAASCPCQHSQRAHIMCCNVQRASSAFGQIRKTEDTTWALGRRRHGTMRQREEGQESRKHAHRVGHDMAPKHGATGASAGKNQEVCNGINMHASWRGGAAGGAPCRGHSHRSGGPGPATQVSVAGPGHERGYS